MQPKGPKRFFTLATVLILFWVTSPILGAEKQPPEGQVAVVNESVITQEDFDREMSRVRQWFRSKGTPVDDSQLPALEKEVLETLINGELLYQESQKEGIEAKEATVDEQLEGIKSRFANEAEFEHALNQMNLSEATIRSQITREMAIQQLIDQEVAAKVTISDDESRRYYSDHPDAFKQPEQVRASHILIKVDPEADESQRATARKEIEALQGRLRKGEDFASLAKEASQCPSAAKGGDLGYFRRGQMVKPFEDVAFSLESGQVSDVVETGFGYHLIKIVDRKPETTMTYEDSEQKLKEYLKKERVQEETRGYVEKLKDKAKVERFR